MHSHGAPHGKGFSLETSWPATPGGTSEDFILTPFDGPAYFRSIAPTTLINRLRWVQSRNGAFNRNLYFLLKAPLQKPPNNQLSTYTAQQAQNVTHSTLEYFEIMY